MSHGTTGRDHPNFVWDMSKFDGWPEQELYHCVEGAREFRARWLEAWDDWKVDLKALRDAGEKVVGPRSLHTREVAGSKPAAPISGRRCKYVLSKR